MASYVACRVLRVGCLVSFGFLASIVGSCFLALSSAAAASGEDAPAGGGGAAGGGGGASDVRGELEMQPNGAMLVRLGCPRLMLRVCGAELERLRPYLHSLLAIEMPDSSDLPFSAELCLGEAELLVADEPAALATEPAACLLYTSPSPRDLSTSRMPSSA